MKSTKTPADKARTRVSGYSKQKRKKLSEKARALMNKPTLVAFLLDRSGSMNDCKAETITGFNAYIATLKERVLSEAMLDMVFTLTQFDSLGIDLIHNAVPLKSVKDLTPETFAPRSMTPLYDAIGKTVRATQDKAGTKYKVLFVTLTDGQENASHEFNLDSIRALIKEMEDKHAYTFAHIGVGADGWTATRSYTAGTRSASNVFMADKGDEKRTYARFAGQTVAHAKSAGNVICSAQNFWKGAQDEPDPTPGKINKTGKGKFTI